MEALPRLPMLSFDLKHSPEYVEFGPTLKQYIKDHYGEEPALYSKACTDLEQLRQAAIQVSRDYMGCTALKKYYTQLEYLQKRFPMGEGGEAAIAFTWEDVQTGRDHVISDIRFEQACILYNIGSLHSLLGVLDTRHNVEGMRVSCTHFQCAAWIFEYLRDNFNTSSMSTDMSYELLSFHIILMLTQAQECILEKSLIDNRKNNITAKVAAQVVEFYKDASRLIDLADQKQQISSRMHKEWGRRLLMKAAFYQCITYYFLGRRSQELEKSGECLAYYTAARDELAKATQLAKNDLPEVLDCLQFAKDVVLGKYESAKKDNDFVYHDKVPALESLPEVKGATLAKGIPVNLTDKEISGPDIFQKLVPMEAHEASSVYSEEKAKLTRQVVGEIEQKNMELEQFMSSLQLDVEQLTPKPDLIPENLMEKCAAMSVRMNAIKELTDSMASVSGLTTEVELSIQEMQQMIDEDAEKTKQFEKMYGKKNPSSVLPGLLEELSGYRKRHEEGSQLNATLHKAMSTHTNNLKTLALAPSEIQAMLPPSQPVLSNEDQEVVNETRRLLQKVNEMKEQRKALLEQFRDKIQKDDITSVLVTQEKADKEGVFVEQLKKHDQIVGYIRQNLVSQDNILRHLTDTNAKFALIRQAYNEASARREKVVHELILSYEKYEELLAKSQKGVDYYTKLLQNVTKTLERCRSECKVRQEERDMLATKLLPKAPAPSRPTAPKPDGMTPSPLDAAAAGATLSGEDFSSLSMNLPGPLPQFQNLPPKFEGPKLKDYLPFMKPRSFGPKASPSAAPHDVASLPASVAPDMPQFDSGDVNMSLRYPGLDPSLASVLPATIAQYLASVSAAGVSLAGGIRPSSSHSPSPQRGSAATPPRHSPSSLTSATLPVSQPNVYAQPQLPSSSAVLSHQVPVDAHMSRAPGSQAYHQPQAAPATYTEQTHTEPNSSQFQPSFSLATFAPGVSTAAGAPYNQQPFGQYGYFPGLGSHQQYPGTSKHADTCTVSAVSQPIFSPGQESRHQAAFQSQQFPQPSSYVPSQHQPHSQHQPYLPQPGQMSVALGQQQQQNWPQSQLPGQTGVHMGPPQVPGSQTHTSEPEMMSVASTQPGPAQTRQLHLGPQQYQLNQASSLGPVQPAANAYLPNTGQLQVGGFTGPQVVGTAGPDVGGPTQLSSTAAGQSPLMGSQHSNLQSGRPGSVPSDANQPAKSLYIANSPHQSPSKTVQAHGQDRMPVTSVGYPSAKGQPQGPLVADFAYPSQQLYQHLESTTYHPSQPYVGGYQHSIRQSYQNAQTFGTFTSKANLYDHCSQPLSTSSGQAGTQSILSHSLGTIQSYQQLGRGPHFQGSKSQDSLQGPHLPSQVQGQGQTSQIPSQIPGSQLLNHQIPGQVQGLQMPGQFQGSQIPGQIQGQQMPGQIPGQQMLGHVQGQQMPGQVQGQQMPGHVQGQQMPGQVQGQHMPGQVQGQQMPGQVQGQHMLGQVQGQHMPGHVQGQQMPGHVQGQQMSGQVQGQQMSGQVQGQHMPGQVQGQQISGQVQGQHMPGQVQGQQMPGQVQGQQMPGQVQGQQMPCQVQGQQMPGQVQGQQMPGQVQGQQMPGQVQGQQMAGQVQGIHMQSQAVPIQGATGQLPSQASMPGIQPYQQPGQMAFQHHQKQLPTQGQPPQQLIQGQPQQLIQGHPPQQLIQGQSPQQLIQGQPPQQLIQGHPPQQGMQGQPPQQILTQGQLPQQLPTQGQRPQFHTQGQLPQQFPAQGIPPQQLLSQGQPAALGQPHQQLVHPGQPHQQLPPGQHFPYSQQLQPQAGFQHQQHQPAPGTTLQPQGFQPQLQSVMQPQLQQHPQLVGPYTPQALPGHGSSQQVSGAAASGNLSPAALQPSSLPGVRSVAPGQAASRPSTPASQGSSNAPPTPTSPMDNMSSVSRQSSSLDDILSSSPSDVNDTIITPQVLTDQERRLQKEEALKNLAVTQASEPYSNQAALNKLAVDVEAFGKFVDELSVTILGVSRLDTVWKSLLDSQDAAVKKQSMAIARCYPMKNRDPDIMPYDETRVVLTTMKDDYINASWLNDLAPSCPKFITTQAPMSLTMGDFWAMVYEQGSEVLVQITSEYETGKKYPVYYPVEKDKALEQGTMLLTLQSVKFRQHWVERILYLKNTQTKQGRTLVHLQYKSWPVSGFPDEISSIVHFISEVHTFYMQQRSLTKPIIVHCGFGIGRSGVCVLVYTAMQEILHGNGLVDVPGLARRMLQKRKGILHKKEQLKCCYDALLYFAEEYLHTRGVLVKNPHFPMGKKQAVKGSPKHQPSSQPATDDIVLGVVDLETIRENVGRLHVHSEADKKEDSSNLAGQSVTRKSLDSLSSVSSSLPDVVQQYSDIHSINELDKLHQSQGSRSDSDPNIMGLQNVQVSISDWQSVSSSSQSLPCSVDLHLDQTILREGSSSPTEGPAIHSEAGSSGSISMSLAQLQDPATFTLGSPDSKKKSKITKANFHQAVGSLQTTRNDPGDPLGSLDPLWTIAKK